MRNPLTVIAIFAGIAEVSGTTVLPFLSDSLQEQFIWFVMGFPVLLVLLFFGTLNFNRESLYAPSDFRDDRAFLASRASARNQARVESLEDDFAYLDGSGEAEGAARQDPEATKGDDGASALSMISKLGSSRAIYLLAEELVLTQLANEIDGKFTRESFVATKGQHFLFDGTIINGGQMTAIEVKYMPERNVNRSVIQNTFRRIDSFYTGMSESERSGFHLIFAVATNLPEEDHPAIKSRILDVAKGFEVPVSVRVFNLADLQSRWVPDDR